MQILGAGIVQPEQEQTLDDGNARPIGGSGGGGGNPRPPKAMRFLKTYKAGIKDLPFLLLVIDLIWYVLSYFNLYSSQYWWIPELTGHSLAFCVIHGFLCLCSQVLPLLWVCIAGLGLLNLLNLLHYFVNFEYHTFTQVA